MNSLNSILLEGTVFADPHLSVTTNDVSVCNFVLSQKRYTKLEDEAINCEVYYFTIQAWSRLAEYSGAMLKKLDKIRIVGHVKQERWTDPDGAKSRVLVIAEHIELIK